MLRKRGKGKRTEYLVKWKNFDAPGDDTWEPANSLDSKIIEDFEKELEQVKANETKLETVGKEKVNNHSSPSEETIVEIVEEKKNKKVVKPTKKNPLVKPKEEDVYNIEALVEKKGSKYLVKWENYPSEQNTWEPKSSIPEYILSVGI